MDASIAFLRKIWYSSTFKNFLFTVIFIWQCFQYGYDEQLRLRPQSTHAWRQADCASFALNYYQNDLDLLNPRMHNQLSGEGKSLGEAPLLYYFVAILYKVFGPHEWVFRAFWILLLYLGLLALFRSALMISGHTLLSLGIAALMFTFPVIVFYGNNFMTDVPAMALAYIAWYFYISYYKLDKRQYLWIASLFFLLAGVHKAHAVISIIALLCVVALQHLWEAIKLKKYSVITHYLKTYAPLLLAFTTILAWYKFTALYAEWNNCNYLSAKIFPFWLIDAELFNLIIENTIGIWKFEYTNSFTFKVLLIIGIVSLLFIAKRKSIFYSLVMLISLIGVFLFILFFLSAFDHHDYYMVNILSVSPFIIIAFILKFKTSSYKNWYYAAFSLFFMYWVYTNSKYAAERQYARYNAWFNMDFHINTSMRTITPYLRSVGINENDLVISIPDESPNISLYYMNQKGWSNFNNENKSAESINEKINLGAKYLIINKDYILNETYLQDFLQNKIGEYEGISIYKL